MLLDDTRRPPGPLGKVLALLGGAALLVLGFMFSLVLLTVAVILVAVAGVYLWWKTRELRRQLRARGPVMPADGGSAGQVFDGEAVRVESDDAGSPSQPTDRAGSYTGDEHPPTSQGKTP